MPGRCDSSTVGDLEQQAASELTTIKLAVALFKPHTLSQLRTIVSVGELLPERPNQA